MKLEKYISDLLYRYDLVIVPEFGGIIGRKKNAHYNKETFVFTPPHKELSFNELLQNNDGLLANYIAEIQGISYKEAINLIDEQVKAWKNILKNKKRLKLDQIGIFNATHNQKLFFLPLTTQNYLTDAYGLTSFIHKPLSESKYAVFTSVATHNTGSIDQVSADKQKKIKQPVRFGLWKYAAILVLGLGIMGGVAKWVNRPDTRNIPVYQKASFVLPTHFPTIIVKEPKTKVVAKTGSTENLQKYFIISGAFREKANADKKIKILQKKGFKASVIGTNRKGLLMVAYEGFASKQEALSKLKKIKKIQPEAWIFTR